MRPALAVDVVVPTIGRHSLGVLLEALAAARGPLPQRILLVDDRPEQSAPLVGELPVALADRTKVLAGRAAGPASARNVGWRAADAAWVAFLDDDVVPEVDWLERLQGDLAGLEPDVAGSQGVIDVPLPADRRPTDWERNVAGLERARWATADMVYRRVALAAVGGFDERFRRAYREDADLALRLRAQGWRLARGTRRVRHPVGPAAPFVSVRLQAGNRDDALMRLLHGRDWRRRAEAPRGCLRRHLVTTASGLAALISSLTGRRRAAVTAAGLWAVLTGGFAWRRIAPGPRTRGEVATMLATSAVLPAAAAAHTVTGGLRAVGLNARVLLPRKGAEASPRPEAVLLDRDGTLVVDVPYNGDPGLVRPLPGVAEAVGRLRAAGIRLAVVTNQSGVGRGLLSEEQVLAVHRRIEELLGPFGAWHVCPHTPDAGCRCRKPAPGLLLRAMRELGVPNDRCVLIGDIGSDVEAAAAAGVRSVLVPTPRTRVEEVERAPEVAPTLTAAVDRLLLAGGGR